MRSKWILIGQSFLKAMRTIGDKKSLLGRGRDRARGSPKSQLVLAGSVFYGLSEYTIQLSSPLSEVGDVNRDFGGALVDASGRHDTSMKKKLQKVTTKNSQIPILKLYP